MIAPRVDCTSLENHLELQHVPTNNSAVSSTLNPLSVRLRLPCQGRVGLRGNLRPGLPRCRRVGHPSEKRSHVDRAPGSLGLEPAGHMGDNPGVAQPWRRSIAR